MSKVYLSSLGLVHELLVCSRSSLLKVLKQYIKMSTNIKNLIYFYKDTGIIRGHLARRYMYIIYYLLGI